MPVNIVIPWETPEWDEYVGSHPGATVFHTSAWCRIVADIGKYRTLCLTCTEDDRIIGVLPLMEVRSWLTGNRLGSLPFSDECFPIAESRDAATHLIAGALRLRAERGLRHYEMRGAPAIDRRREPDTAAAAGLASRTHFYTYTIALQGHTEALRLSFQAKLRQMINKSQRNGVTVRRVDGAKELRECYRLYVLNRRRHGIPPQSFALYHTIAERLRRDPEAIFYLASHQGVNVASLVALRYRGVTTGKYEGIDPAYRALMPIHPLLWASIRDAAESGDHTYDLGRTAMDNPGLNEFKSRWGSRRVELPYFYFPGSEGLSVVRSDSWKYRLFTGVFQRLPYGVTVYLGGRIFRHFG